MVDTGAKSTYRIVHNSFDPLPPQIVKLLDSAATSLANEDEALKKAFDNAKMPSFYAGVNHGLAYAVFETQLVYAIFKSWIPMANVEWESKAYEGSPYRADLAVCDDGSNTPSLVFEAKWWNFDFRYSNRQNAAIDAD